MLITNLLATYALAVSGITLKSYDPLATLEPSASPILMTLNDATRKREIAIKVYLPASKAATNVILFSHGLGGSREANGYMGEHYSHRGYVAIHMQHLGSDDSVWRNTPRLQRMAAMKKAANAENFIYRAQDVKFVLDELERQNKDGKSVLFRRLVLKSVGMTGHSFGAGTSQALSGQNFPPQSSPRFTDKRIGAALLLSPSIAEQFPPEKSFGSVLIPWMVLTGTKDDSPIGRQTAKDRMKVYPALPKGEKFELVLDGANHMDFSDPRESSFPGARDPHFHRAILALSTAFWDAYLKGDSDAKSWLISSKAQSVLKPTDRWQLK